MAHAVYSPSGYERWGRCPGSINLTKDLPRKSTAYSLEGTLAHEVAQRCLTDGLLADSQVGLEYIIEERAFVVSTEMAEHVQTYLDLIATFHGSKLVEQKLPISHITGEEDAHGTADCVILADDELMIIDLKYGMGVRVDAERNSQLMIYALAGMEAYSWAGDFSKVRLVICQPRLDHISEWVVEDVEALSAFALEVRSAVEATQQPEPEIVPGEKQCRFCPAASNCTALAEHVYATIADDFVDLNDPLPTLRNAMERTMDNHQLAQAMSSLDLISQWIKTVRNRVMEEFKNGREVPGFKVVQGRRGNRKWADETAVWQVFQEAGANTEDYVEVSLISPTNAAKAFKGTDLWQLLAESHVIQPEGKPSIAPTSDKRPSISITDDFEDFDL